MGNLSALKITKAGRKVLAQAQTGLPLNFTRVAAGDGEVPGGADVDDMTDVAGHVMNLPINGNKIIGDGTTELEVILRNAALTDMFEFREVGIFAADNDTGGEVLYAYSNSGDAPAAYIPAGGGPNAVNLRIKLITVIKQAPNVVVDITDGWGFVTRDEWEDFTLNLYGPDIAPPAFLWTADEDMPETLRRMPFHNLTELMFAPTAPGSESVLIGYDPVTNSLFGYPIGEITIAAKRLRGGVPSMQTADYPDGALSGGDPSMLAGDYPDGRVSGGHPYTT
jgi:hypothetical protein